MNSREGSLSIEELADFITRGAATFFADGPEGGPVIPGKNGAVGGGEDEGDGASAAAAGRQAAQAKRDAVRRARAERAGADGGADDGSGGGAGRRGSSRGGGGGSNAAEKKAEEEEEEEEAPPVWVRPHQKRRPLSEKEANRDAKAREQRHHAKERYEAMKVR